MEQLKPYMHVKVRHLSEWNVAPLKDKDTKIEMRECRESDFSNKPWILKQYRTLDYF